MPGQTPTRWSPVLCGAPPDPLGPLAELERRRALAACVEATDADAVRATLRAAMRHAGGPSTMPGPDAPFSDPARRAAVDGAYVRYPFRRCCGRWPRVALRGRIVIGEDLGTVPDGFRPKRLEAGLLGYRVVWFERDWPDPRFLPADRYPAQALATISTHDLPTVRGFRGERHRLRERLGHIGADALRAEHENRARDSAARRQAACPGAAGRFR